MALILGEAGRYVRNQAVRRRSRLLLTGLVGFAALGILLGLDLQIWIPFGRFGGNGGLVYAIILAVACMALGKFLLARFDILERERRAMLRGAEGEERVALILDDLSDDFGVIHGLATQFGDLDHIVVGPTGVFIIDTKNWRGVVTSDGNGDLLLNGRPTDKATIRPIVARTMGVREKVGTLCGFEPPFFTVVIVFPSAWVDARWGTTGPALCVTDEQLHGLLVEEKNRILFDGRKVQSLTKAFAALAAMDIDLN